MEWLLAFRGLKKHKKRSFTLMISIILSTVLLVALMQISNNLKSSMIEVERKSGSGDFHFDLEEQLAINFDNLEKYIPKNAVAYRLSPVGIYNEGELMISIEGFENQEMLEKLGIEIKEGKFPDKDNEILIGQWELENLGKNLKIGDELELEYFISTQKEKTKFIISGILVDKSKLSGTGNIITNVNTAENILTNEKQVKKIFIKFDNEVNVRRRIEKIKNTIKDSVIIKENSRLVDIIEYKEINKVTILIACIISFASMLIIYNMFNISALERIKDFGILKALGFDKRNIEKIIFLEGILLLIPSLIIGIVLGLLLGIKGTEVAINQTTIGIDRLNNISIFHILSASCFVVLSTIISLLKPAKLSGELSPLLAVRGSGRLNLKKNSKKTKKNIWEKYFGIKGKLAFENMFVYKKRSILTMASIVVSLVLFLTMTCYFNSSSYGSGLEELIKSDYTLTKNIFDKTDFFDENVISDIKNLDGVTNVKGIGFINNPKLKVELNNINISSSKLQNSDYNIKVINNSFFYLTSNFYTYDEETMKNIEDNLIEGDYINSKDTKIFITKKPLFLGKDIEFNYKVGDKIKIILDMYSPIEREVELEIGGFISDANYEFSSWSLGPEIVVSKGLAEKLGLPYKTQKIFIDVDEINESIDGALREISINSNSLFFSMEEAIKSSKEAKKQMMMLVGMFVGVIFLIGIFNVLNTINTNMIIRKKEFALIRAIGFEKKDLSHMVSIEGLIWGVITSTIALPISIGLSLLLMSSNEKGLNILNLPFGTFIIVFFGNILVCLLMSLPALKRALGVSMVEAFREI